MEAAVPPAPIIDAHTHIFAPDVAERRERYLERDRWFGLLHESPAAAIVQAAELLAAMDEAGVDGAVACGWPWADHGICRDHNDALADAARL
ncbi:MAG TPA: amidohydrolase, partial [Thermomicrobiales bacterium]|nr:amidohydrolase [Thermomicrobiales bacterium]